MSLILHLETATKVCSVALSLNGELVALRELTDDSYAHGERLTLLIEDVLKANGNVPKDLAAVSVASGPGSYTGLRIGVSTAKGLCYALGIPLLSVDALVSMASVARERYEESTLCPMIDARRMEVYSAIYGPELELLKPISADILDDTSYEAFEPFVFFGDGAEKVTESWAERNVLFDGELRPSATGQIKIAYAKFQQQDFEDVAYFEPFYLKEFIGGKKKGSEE